MTPKKPLDAIRAELWRRFDEAGFGSIARTQEALGVKATYFKDWKRKKAKPGLDALLKTLKVLDVDPAEFFDAVFGFPDPIAVLRRETAALGPPPEIVARLRAHLEQAPGELEKALTASQSKLIDRLDALRYDDGHAAVEQAELAMERVLAGKLRRSVGLRLLGVWGSAKRILVELDAAQQGLVAGFDIAKALGDRFVLGDFYQRLSYVLGDRGRHVVALELCDRALVAHSTAGSKIGIGRALVDRSMWLSRLGKLKETVEAAKAGLAILPNAEKRNRFAALQTLGLVYLRLGNLKLSARYAREARLLVSGLGRCLLGKLSWLQGRISKERLELKESERLFTEAADAFGVASPVECAVVSTELVRTLLLQTRTAEAYRTAVDMARLLEPLKTNKLAEAALLDLLRFAAAGRDLTVAFIDEVITRLEEARAHPKRRTR